MNQQMWRNPATVGNVATLRSRGMHIVDPDSGEQACGDLGPGRMAEPTAIARAAAQRFASGLLAGQHVLVTAGPTREALDPVRYLSNHSSGRMGYALAQAALDAGAALTLVSGPVALQAPQRARLIAVNTAREMLEACLEQAAEAHIFIACAAVADYRPAHTATEKIAKNAPAMRVALVRNPDVLAEVSRSRPQLFCVGFAAQTHALRERARAKLEKKRLDMIVANDVSDPAIGFNSADNAALLLWPGGERAVERCSKSTLARLIVEEIARRRVPCG